tara:strand:+ start:69 stop:476 length:408 start_codon:yes stop_codon:yes gene_type:complete
MDNFDLRNYLTEGKIYENSYGDISFLNKTYSTQEDFDEDRDKFENLIDKFLDVPSNNRWSGDRTLEIMDLDYGFEDTFEDNLPINGWDILGQSFSSNDIDNEMDGDEDDYEEMRSMEGEVYKLFDDFKDKNAPKG